MGGRAGNEGREAVRVAEILTVLDKLLGPQYNFPS
jgi:hypothetical protein